MTDTEGMSCVTDIEGCIDIQTGIREDAADELHAASERSASGAASEMSASGEPVRCLVLQVNKCAQKVGEEATETVLLRFQL